MNKQSLDGKDWVNLIEAAATAIDEASDRLNDLDRALGDGDHGYNLAAGLRAAAEAAGALSPPSPQEVLIQTGNTIRNKMGGASGSVFGAFFRGCGRETGDLATTTAADLHRCLRAGLEQVQKRGKVQPGQKTVVDALAPVVDAVEKAVSEGLTLAAVMETAAQAAAEGARQTVEMQAQTGRAKFLGERSIGHPDPGATSMSVIFTAWAAVLTVKEENHA